MPKDVTISNYPAFLKSIKGSFPYLSADIQTPEAPDHPSLTYANTNSHDHRNAENFSVYLDTTAHEWAVELSRNVINPEMRLGCDGLLQALRAITATSVMTGDRDRLFVERPGIELPGRREEILNFCKGMMSDPANFSPEEKLFFARLCLLGLAKIPFETANYCDPAEIPDILSKMIARLIALEGSSEAGINPIEFLKNFIAIEDGILKEKNISRIGIPCGSRPRIYVPNEALEMDENAYLASKEILFASRDKKKAMTGFLSLMWRDFCDEAYVAEHRGNMVQAFALVAGCCYFYEAEVKNENGKTEVSSSDLPKLIDSAGEYRSTAWRRNVEGLGFERGIPTLKEARSQVIELEKLSEEERRRQGVSGVFLKAVHFMLARQINHNMAKVCNSRMGRIVVPEWAPNMSRNKDNVVYNPAHAMGGVGDMFRGPLMAGDSLSQIRTWRERDGTHRFSDVNKFIAYARAVNEYLESGIN